MIRHKLLDRIWPKIKSIKVRLAIVLKCFKLSSEKSVMCFCYLKIYMQNDASTCIAHVQNKSCQACKQTEDGWNSYLRNGDKIQNGRDRKLCRLT